MTEKDKDFADCLFNILFRVFKMHSAATDPENNVFWNEFFDTAKDDEQRLQVYKRIKNWLYK